MTAEEACLVDHLRWVDDDDFQEGEREFVRGLVENPGRTLTAPESKRLARIYQERSY